MRMRLSNVLKADRVQALLLGIATMGCVYLSFSFSTISYMDQRLMFFHLLLAAGAGIFYLWLCRKISTEHIWRGQILTWNTIYSICSLLFFACNFGKNIRSGNWQELLSQLIYMCIAAWAEYELLRQGGGLNIKKFSFLKFLKQYKGLLVLCAAALVLALDADMIQFKWDGSTYYDANNSATLYSISSMALCGHICQTFSMINLFFGAVLGHNLAYGMAAGNMVLYLFSICAAYGILKTILPKLSEAQYILGTAVYAFSPFVLGMVNYYGVDFHSMCIYTIVMYCTVKQKWMLQVISGMFFSFTKEPAFLVYGMLCAGVVLGEILFSKQDSLWERIKRQFVRVRNYGMLMVAAIWGLTVMRLGIWGAGGDYGGFALDGTYILDKLKVLLVMNFNWLFVIIILCGVVAWCFSKKTNGSPKAWMIPLLSSGGAYIVLGCLFKTVNHPRYAAVMPVVLYLLAMNALIFLLRHVWKGRLLYGVLPVLSSLMLVSSFWTIDPVSKSVFQTIPMGSGEMITTGLPLGDAAIYNKQMLWLEHALNDAIKDGVETEDKIIFPMVNGTNYCFDGLVGLKGSCGPESGGYSLNMQYWNMKKNRRELLASDQNVPLRLYEIISAQALAELASGDSEDQRYRYFYLEFAGKEIAEEVKVRYTVLGEKEFHYRGWTVYEILFEQ